MTHFVAGGSTGGTITGTGRYLKSVDPTIKIVLADPKGSVLWDYFVNDVPEEELEPKSWEVEGVGKDSIPGVLDTDVIDGAVLGDDKSSFRTVRMVAESSGVLLGGSSGLNLHARCALLSSHIKRVPLSQSCAIAASNTCPKSSTTSGWRPRVSTPS